MIKTLRRSDELRMGTVLVAIWLVFAFSTHGFVQHLTFTNILNRSSITGLLVVGLTLCLLAGEIDLSIGATLALASVVYASVQPHNGVLLACILSVLSGLGVGLVNVILVNVAGVISFVATLGTMLLAEGVSLVIAHGAPVATNDFSLSLRMSRGFIGPIAPPFLVLVGVAVVAHVFVVNTRAGRELVAVGSDPKSAVVAGVNAPGRRAAAFMACSACAAIAGVVSAMSLASGTPTPAPTDLLNAVAAAFVSGVALSGGRGSVLAAAIAAVALSALGVGLETGSINSAYEQVITGALIVLIGVPTTLVRSRIGWRKLSRMITSGAT